MFAAQEQKRLPLTTHKQQILDKMKTFLCPTCRHRYDFHFRNETLSGRVPLILPCKHTICEGCVRISCRHKQISCPKCSFSIPLDKPDIKLQELFPVNFYILGLIYYSRPKPSDHLMEHNFTPSGFRPFSHPPKAPIENLKELAEFETVTQEFCSGVDCNRKAEVECEQCSDMFCATCCDKFHKMVRGFRKHKIIPLAQKVIKEISKTCPAHTGTILEYHCAICKVDVCCHCFIQQHTGHPYYLVTELPEESRQEFMDLVVGAEDMLKRLEVTQKTINHRMNQLSSSRTTTNTTEAEHKLSEGFANLHAQLQILEEKFRVDVVQAVNSSYYKLTEIATELDNDVRALNNLLYMAKTILNGGSNQKKINVQMVMDKLRNVEDLPCYLVGKQTNEGTVSVNFSEALENLERHITITNGAVVDYHLVPKSTAAEDTEEFEVLGDTSVNSTAFSSTTVSRDMSTNSVAHSSDSESFGSADAKGSSSSSLDVSKWLQNVRTEKRRKSHQRFSTTPDVNFENVDVVHINSPSSFYVQLVRSKQQLQNMSDELSVHIKNLAGYVHEPAIDEIYAVKYEIRSNKYQWCRGRVTEIINREPVSENLYHIFYLDYGNTQNVKKTHLRRLSPELLAIPPFAVHCSLYNILPKNKVWSRDATQLMVQIIDRNEVIMYVEERLPHIFNVDLVAFSAGTESTSIRDALLFTGFAVLEDSNHKIETPIQTLKSDDIKLIKNKEIYRENTTIDVIITHIKDPNNIYVQRTASRTYIKDFEATLEEYYNNSKKKFRVYNPKKGMPVIVNQSESLELPKWCRGEITNIVKGAGSVEVFLVDYGHTISVSWMNLRRIQHEFITTECLALLVKLADVEPLNSEEGWNNDSATAYLNAYVQDKKNFKIVVSEQTDRLVVALFECFPDMDICVNAVLVESGLAVSSGKLSQNVKWQKDRKEKKPEEGFTTSLLKTIQSTTKQSEERELEPEDEFSNVIKKEVNILRVDSPDAIYIQFKDDWIINRYSEMDKGLQEFYSKNKPEAKSIAVGDRCIAYKKSSDQYYRATVLEKTDTKTRVELCDTAEEIEVDGNEIYNLDDQFRVYPNFTVKCHLDGILPAGDSKKWSFLAVEYLQELFQTHTNIVMTKNGMADAEKNTWPSVMWYVELISNGPLEPTQRKLHCINKNLVTNGLALKKRVGNKPAVNTQVQPNENVAEAIETPTENIISQEENLILEKSIVPISVSSSELDYLPAPPIKKNKFVGIVTFVDEYGVIHLQDNDMQQPFEEMVKQTNAYFENNIEVELPVFEPGDLCTVMYHDNNYWYRGKVVKREPNGDYKVHVIDYGNEETCKPSDLRKTVMFLDIPSFSHKVKLNNVFSREKKWLASDIDILQAMFDNHKIVVTVKKKNKNNKPAFVDIYTEDGVFANEYIVKHSSNLSNKPIKKVTEILDSDDDVIIDDIIEEIVKDTFELQQSYTLSELPPIGTKLEIGIINMLNYNDLIFEINSCTESEDFILMSSNIQDEGDQQPNLKVIKVQQPCIARYSEDGQWYRAQIMDILTSNVVKIWFVDFGNFEDVRINELKEIKPEWMKYPLQHYRAEIYGIKVRDESRLDIAMKFLTDLCGTIRSARIVEIEPLKIELYKSDSNDELLYWHLIEDGVLAL